MVNPKIDLLNRQLQIPIVNPRKYWFVRTNGGAYYEDFTLNSYIGLGWDYITPHMILSSNPEAIKEQIRTQRESNSEDSEEPDDSDLSYGTKTYNKILRFVKEFSIGDVVLIPSKNTDRLAIGIIKSDIYLDPNYTSNYISAHSNSSIKLCPYHKRRSVEWQKGINKTNLDMYLAKAVGTHHAVSDISDYAPFINREIYPAYISEDYLHVTIHAGHPDGVSLLELRDLINTLDSSFSDASIYTHETYDPQSIDIKLNIHSPGLIELSCSALGFGLAISAVLMTWNHLINGGTLKLSYKTKNHEFLAESTTEGTNGRKIQELKLQHEEKIKELSQHLDMTLPALNSDIDVLELPSEDSMEK